MRDHCKVITFELKDFVVQFKTPFGSGRSRLNLSDVDPSIRVAGRRFRVVLINASSKFEAESEDRLPVGVDKRVAEFIPGRLRMNRDRQSRATELFPRKSHGRRSIQSPAEGVAL